MRNILTLILVAFVISGCSNQTPKETSNSKTSQNHEISVIILKAPNPIADDEMSVIRDTLTTRMKDLGYNSIEINALIDNQLEIRVTPQNSDIKAIAEIISKPNKFRVVGPKNQTILTQKDIQSASFQGNENNKTFDVKLTPEGIKKLTDASSDIVGEQIKFYLDEKQMADLRVSQAITTGDFVVPGSSTALEAKTFASILNTGKSLPYPLDVISVDEEK